MYHNGNTVWTNGNLTTPSVNPDTITVGQSTSLGSGTSFAYANHAHGTPSTWTPSAHSHGLMENMRGASSVSFSPNTSTGRITVPHGLGLTPSSYVFNAFGNVYISPDGADSTNIYGIVRKGF